MFVSRFILSLIGMLYVGIFSSFANAAVITGIPCAQITDQIKTIQLIGLDDLLVPIQTNFVPTAGSLCFKADFNGDGKLDLFVQGYNSTDESFVFFADTQGKYLSIGQRWSNGNHLGMDWAVKNTTIYIGNFDGDNRSDMIFSSSNGANTLIYSDPSGRISAVSRSWSTYAAASDGSGTPVAGNTPGDFNAEGGAASYSVPIEVPPGVAGMTPTLTLNYNSMGGNGYVGVGWSLGGMSTITRCGRSYAVDGYKRGINLNGGDAYCLDGKRLIEVSGGSAGQQRYTTDIEEFTVVTAGGSVSGGNPAYFIAETKSGLILTFGNYSTNDTRIEIQGSNVVVAWPVSRIKDKYENYIQFEYFELNSTGEFYPKKISYTGGMAQSPSRFVEFSYHTSRPDPLNGYFKGSLASQNWLLKNIKTKVGTSSVQELNLNYEQSATTGRSRLANLQKCALDGQGKDCLKPVSFAWQEGGQLLFPAPPQFRLIKDPAPVDAMVVRVLGYPDINGDGFSDICREYKPSEGPYYVQCQLSTINANNGFANGAVIPDHIPLDGGSYPKYDSTTESYKRYYLNPDNIWENPIGWGDIDGDFRQELFVKTPNGVEVWRYDGTSFVKVSPANGLKAGDSDNLPYIEFPDINGDGKSDLCYRGDGGITN